ncbi:hypothetical protein, partial [Streptococcus pneumoniae]|uniref:hypothetical protein n=1 Tax=Streptococcus pneumoniae TaxID=1313 RepID=UPI000AEFA5B5
MTKIYSSIAVKKGLFTLFLLFIYVLGSRITLPFVDLNTKPQLFTPNLKTIQNPCLSLDPGWFLFSPNGCF